MSVLDIVALLIVFAALFGTLNHFFLRLPSTIGITVVALLASLLVIGVDWVVPPLDLAATARGFVLDIDFSEALLKGMLGLLLFAGALHVRLEDLAQEKWIVAIMASLGVLISTLIIGVGVHWLLGIPFLVALVFGSLISPTDPVAVLGVLKTADVPKSLETKIAGESLFNDGIAYVVFLILVAIAFGAGEGHGAQAGHGTIGAVDIAQLFVVEAGGGAVLGGVLGYLVFLVMRRIDDYSLEVLLTLALAFGGYALASALHMSGPITVVIAGLFIGNTGIVHAMSEKTREHVDAFWRLIDEILNAVLFLLIGLEVFAVSFDVVSPGMAATVIALVLGARTIAVLVSMTLLRRFRTFLPGSAPILIWGGLRGGISVALVLSLPANEWQTELLTLTYAVVLFSIIVQGLSVPAVVNRFARDQI
ncbi:MAG: cation:proton antiporter [Alphaproteobacteria bacterium]